MTTAAPDSPEILATLRVGCGLFDAGRYERAQQTWEQLWRGYDGGGRRYLQGLIQLAAVQHHLQRGAADAALALLERGHCARHFAAGEPERWPLDTGHILTVVAALHAALRGGRTTVASRLRLEPMLGTCRENALLRQQMAPPSPAFARSAMLT